MNRMISCCALVIDTESGRIPFLTRLAQTGFELPLCLIIIGSRIIVIAILSLENIRYSNMDKGKRAD